MINDLDRTLEELLLAELPPELKDQVAISFATPDDQFPPTSVTLPAIDFFLYDVRENLEFRTNEVIRKQVKSGGRKVFEQVPPPARVDCSYLVTAWGSDSAPNPARDEHRILGEVMRVLLAHRRFPESVLRGELKKQSPPIRALPLQGSQLQSLGEFWQALGGKPKAALNYAVTISVAVAEPTTAPIVEKKTIDMVQIKGGEADEGAPKARRGSTRSVAD